MRDTGGLIMSGLAYDSLADVLYITIKDAPGIADEISDDVFVRRDEKTDEVVGITIMNISDKI